MKKKELKDIRKKTGLTQKDFAKGIGVSGKLVEMMEQGKRKITPRTALSIFLLLPRIDEKKGIAQEKPTCPFCGSEIEIKTIQGTGSQAKHQCQSGVQISTQYLPKDMLLRALTPITRMRNTF